MKLLLDTHALIWWLLGKGSLSTRAVNAIGDPNNTVFVIAASAMEITIKVRFGKLPSAEQLARDFESMVASQGFSELPISVTHARVAGSMQIAHKDPFDRFLLAQAQLEDMVLVSNETLFDTVAVQRL